MHVIIMGCGRVGSELANAIADEHDVAIIDKNPEAFHAYPPGSARQIVGLGFDRDVLEDAGIKDADAFVAVSSGDNSNIVSARVALEYYHVPKVIARIYDSRRAGDLRAPEHPDRRHHAMGRQADPAHAVPRPRGDPRNARRG